MEAKHVVAGHLFFWCRARRMACVMSSNWSLGTDPQQQEAAARQMLRAGQL